MTQTGQQSWLEAIYESVHDSDESDYEDTLSLLCLIAMTGNYWHPETLAPPSVPVPSRSGALLPAISLLTASASAKRR